MADPLSVTASIVAVLQLTAVVIKYIQELRTSSKDAGKLLLELSSLRGIVGGLEDLANSDEAWIETSKTLVARPNGPISRLEYDLESLRAKLEPAVGIKKIQKSITWPFKQDELRSILDRIERLKSLFLLALELDHISLAREINNNVADVRDRLDHLQLQQNDALRHEILKWLSSVDPSENHNDACNKHEPSTGGWLIESEILQSWLRKEDEVLWLHGIPGSGKSILCCTIIEHVKSICEQTPGLGYAYFYFDFKESAKQNVENLYRSLLAQLSAQLNSIPPEVQDLYEAAKTQSYAPKLEKIMRTLLAVLKQFDRAYILIDALDECSERVLLLQHIQNLVKVKARNWNLLLTSRREQDIETELESTVTSNVGIQSGDTAQDVRTLIRSRLKQDPRLRRRPSVVKAKIERSLEEGACGMFAWVTCQLDLMSHCLSPSALERALSTLPRTLDETYERILLRIPEEHHQAAFLALQFLAFSTRPVGVDCLAEVVAVQPGCSSWDKVDRLFDPRDILTICASLVTIQENHSVQLAHYSVKEYLLSPRILGGPAQKFYLDFATAHKEIALLCIDYIHLIFSTDGFAKKNPWDLHLEVEEYPLVGYAIFEWFQHASAAENNSQSQSDALGARLLQSMEDPTFIGWRRAFLAYESRRGQAAPYWSSAKGDPHWQYGTPLCWAAFLGLPKTVEMFLNQGAHVNEAGPKHYVSPLQAAAYQGFPNIVKILLDHGADINRKESSHGTSLQAAMESRDPATVALLLDSGADVNICHGYSHSPLQAALTQAMPEFVPRLISLGANVNAQGGQFGTALQAAARYGHEAAVDLLLQNGAIVNTSCGYYGNPLQAACKGGHTSIVRKLLDLGADANATGAKHRNAFRAALCMYELLTTKKEILTMLVQAGVRMPLDSLLIALNNEEKIDIIELIVKHDQTIGSRECDTEVSKALSKSHWKIVELLMECTIWNPDLHVKELIKFEARCGNVSEKFRQKLREYIPDVVPVNEGNLSGTDGAVKKQTMDNEACDEADTIYVMKMLEDPATPTRPWINIHTDYCRKA